MSDQPAPFLWIDDPPGSDAPCGGATVREPAAEPSPGEAGLWVFVLGDMTVFALFFVVLLVERRLDHAGFVDAARHLALPIGLANTLILLSGSAVVMLALDAHRGGDHRRCRRFLSVAVGLAGSFVVLKAVEYTVEAGRGVPGVFAVLYFSLTGLHLVHVLIGGALLTRWRALVGHGRPWSRDARFAEGSAVYWHMVDLLWVVIFTLAYLVARH